MSLSQPYYFFGQVIAAKNRAIADFDGTVQSFIVTVVIAGFTVKLTGGADTSCPASFTTAPDGVIHVIA